MSPGFRRGWLLLGVVVALVATATASAGARSPASGTVGFGPLNNRTEVQKGSKIVVEGRRQAGLEGTLSLGPIVGSERRVRHASGRLKWTMEFADVPFNISAPGCPASATLTIRFAGKVKPGETTLRGRFRGRSDTGDVRVKGKWTVTGVGPGVGGQPLFLNGSVSTYTGSITCKTARPRGGDDDDDGDEDDDEDDD
jgi:hypothetical protein